MFLNFNDESGCIKIASSWVESLQLNVSQTINYCTLEVMREDDEHLKEIICFWKFLRTSVIFGTAGLFLASRNLNCCYTTFTSHLPARFYEYFLTWGLTHAEHLLPDSDVWMCRHEDDTFRKKVLSVCGTGARTSWPVLFFALFLTALIIGWICRDVYSWGNWMPWMLHLNSLKDFV